METHLTYDNKGKQLGILVKERLTTDQNLQLKVVGVLNTVTGGLECCAKIRKFFGTPKPRTRTANALPREYLMTIKRKGLVGIGGTYLSGTDDVLAGVTAQKQFFFGPARSPLAVKLKAQADYNLQTKQVDGIGRAQLSKTIYNFTDMQDLRLVLGCKAHIDQKGKVTPIPYGRLQENNWSLFCNFRGYWGVRYDL